MLIVLVVSLFCVSEGSLHVWVNISVFCRCIKRFQCQTKVRPWERSFCCKRLLVLNCILFEHAFA